ncbi:MAG: segregation/condensation protein A [Candidatus Aenigmarchaeota archaeon]|nr:segregation/condensation protein A [Candidatus Aenigmarchaeota archaeon]
MEIDESKLIKTIVVASDWEDVLNTIVWEEGLDPLNIDIVQLAQAFMNYIHNLDKFSFRVPARFILVASILLTMKCDTILAEEEEKEMKALEGIKLNLDAPLLMPPLVRKTTRKVSLAELVSALNKAFEIKKKKESFLTIRKPHIEIVEPDDIEERIKEIYEKVKNSGMIRFSDLVPVWKKAEIIDTLMPLLYLSMRSMILCEQEDMFKEIYIKLK